MVKLSHPYATTGKTITLIRWTFVSKVMSLLFNRLSRLVIAFLPGSKRLFISWLAVTIYSDFGAQKNFIFKMYVFISGCAGSWSLCGLSLVVKLGRQWLWHRVLVASGHRGGPPGSGMEPMSPALAGRSSTTGPPGKSYFSSYSLGDSSESF